MRFGPDKIIACPHCEKPARKTSLMSGNTLGSTLWSDGQRLSPMLLRNPSIVKCGDCGRVYWLSDATFLGECSREGKLLERRAWKEAGYIQEPDEKDYFRALKEGLAETAAQERHLRILTWWKSNESQRRCYPNPEQAIDTSMRQDNIAALIPLLDEESPKDLLMKAEALRQLSRFDEALVILEQMTSSESLPVVLKLKKYCEEKNGYLQCIEGDFEELSDHEEQPEEDGNDAFYIPTRTAQAHLNKPWWKLW